MKFLNRKLKNQLQSQDFVGSVSSENQHEPEAYLHPNFRHWMFFRPSSHKDGF
jgi:hypothetical protein